LSNTGQASMGEASQSGAWCSAMSARLLQTKLAPKEILAAAALGEDPAASRSHARKTPTFREFAERYLTEQAIAKLKPRTVAN
jgi:hypothetical protein